MFFREPDPPSTAGIRLKALLVIDPSMTPAKEKPQEDDIQDAKLLYYYSPHFATIHTKRLQTGLAEGLLSFLGSFNDGGSDTIEVELDGLHLAAVSPEPSLLFCILAEKLGSGEEGEWLENWATALAEKLYQHFTLFYGTINSWRHKTSNDDPDCPEEHKPTADPDLSIELRLGGKFAVVMDHFIQQFISLSTQQEEPQEGVYQIPSDIISVTRIQPVGLERFGLQKSQFLVTAQIEENLRSQPISTQVLSSWCLFYRSFFVYGTLEYTNVLLLKDYMFGNPNIPTNRLFSFVDRFTDFRKCTLSANEYTKNCRYGLLNTAKDSKDILLGDIVLNTASSESFIPTLHLPKTKHFQQVQQPGDYLRSPWAGIEVSEKSAIGQDGTPDNASAVFDRHDLRIYKVGNFTMCLLSPSGSQQAASPYFSSVIPGCKQLLEHCERLLLNQMGLLETATQKRTNLNALIFNESNKSVICYPFNKFSLARLPPVMSRFITKAYHNSKLLGVVEAEIGIDGWQASLMKWNGRSIVLTSEDKKSSYKEFSEKVVAFKQGLQDIFI